MTASSTDSGSFAVPVTVDAALTQKLLVTVCEADFVRGSQSSTTKALERFMSPPRSMRDEKYG
jgi:hypothetical protein